MATRLGSLIHPIKVALAIPTTRDGALLVASTGSPVGVIGWLTAFGSANIITSSSRVRCLEAHSLMRRTA